MQNNPIEILAVNGTKIDSFLEDEISIAGYHLIRKDRNRHGGGVLLNVRRTTHCTERNDLRVHWKKYVWKLKDHVASHF